MSVFVSVLHILSLTIFLFLSVDPLAYLTAKTNSLADLAAEILESAGLTEADVDDVPSFGISTLKPPPIVTPTTDLLWPSLSTGENFFDRALVNGQLEGGVEPAYVNGDAAAAGHSALDAWAKEEEDHEDIDPEEGGWELDADGGEFHPAIEETGATEEEELGAGATPGPAEPELWVRNSPLAVDHVAAGSFETAMQVRCYVFRIGAPVLSIIISAPQPSIWRRQLCFAQASFLINIPIVTYLSLNICFCPTSKTARPSQSKRNVAQSCLACCLPVTSGHPF